MSERYKHINIDDERLLESARAYGAAFPQFAELVATIEARIEERLGAGRGDYWVTRQNKRGCEKSRNPLICLAPRVGLEPTTNGLTVRRSTN